MQRFPSPGELHNRRISAFTLVELLAVISIAGLLAALLVPTVSGSLKKAKNVQDIANLRQLGTLSSQYAGENNGAFVPGKGADGQQWQVQLARLFSKEQVDGIWVLPDWSVTPAKIKKEYAIFSPPGFKLDGANYWQTGYGINMGIGLPENDKVNTAESWGQLYTAAGVTALAKRPLLFGWPEWNAYPESVTDQNYAKALGPTGQLNILFCDGHVGSVGKNDQAVFKKMLEDPASL